MQWLGPCFRCASASRAGCPSGQRRGETCSADAYCACGERLSVQEVAHRAGYGRKTVLTDTGKIALEVPRDRSQGPFKDGPIRIGSVGLPAAGAGASSFGQLAAGLFHDGVHVRGVSCNSHGFEGAAPPRCDIGPVPSISSRAENGGACQEQSSDAAPITRGPPPARPRQPRQARVRRRRSRARTRCSGSP